jgi:hypothetical protein
MLGGCSGFGECRANIRTTRGGGFERRCRGIERVDDGLVAGLRFASLSRRA